jgi:hypothetical protein
MYRTSNDFHYPYRYCHRASICTNAIIWLPVREKEDSSSGSTCFGSGICLDSYQVLVDPRKKSAAQIGTPTMMKPAKRRFSDHFISGCHTW